MAMKVKEVILLLEAEGFWLQRAAVTGNTSIQSGRDV
jgi:predicted RNA binding protein YcfA (HicA-like mRNA interferase family)